MCAFARSEGFSRRSERPRTSKCYTELFDWKPSTRDFFQQLVLDRLYHYLRSKLRFGCSQKSLEPALESWLQSKGLPSQKVDIAHFQQQGRGLLSNSRIRKGERLLQIPESVLLTPDSAVAHSQIGKQLEASGVPAWSALAIALTESRFSERALEWRPYAQALPQSTGCVLEWEAEEVDLLKGTSLHAEALVVVEAAKKSIEELGSIIAKAEQDSNVSKGLFSEKRLRWAFGILLSRLVRLPSWQNQEALCPWADMMNHDCRATTHLDYDAGSRSICLEVDRNYQPGEQVMASYGGKTSGQLLLSYGFAPPASENPHDSCLFKLEISSEDPLQDAKAAALQPYGIKPSQAFPLRMSGLPQGVLQFAAFKDAEPDDPSEVCELAEWLFGRGQFPVLDGVDTELLGVEVLREELKTALEGFSESVEENQKLLEQLASFPAERDSSASTPQARKALITAVKIQEQKVLQRTLFVLQQRRKELNSR